METRPTPAVLCVDDEPIVLDGLKRNLRGRFAVQTAMSGAAGLRAIAERGPFAVVVSDLRMPGMDGIAFLANVRECAPDITRVLLTGNADLESAIGAVNEGNIFRFLSKPCPPATLIKAIEASTELHRLVTAERILLEQTLLGSVKMLTEVLSLASPIAFGRANRVKQRAGALAAHLGSPPRWQMELAAMLSQVGYIGLPAETLEKVQQGSELSSSEQAMVDRVPGVARSLLANIPRLDSVLAILHHQRRRFDGAGGEPKDRTQGTQIPLGARILKVVVDFDLLESQGLPPEAALETLLGRTGEYDPGILAAAGELGGYGEGGGEVRDVQLYELTTGMVLVEDVLSADDRLLVGHGHEVSEGLLERLRNFSENLGIKLPLRVLVRHPKSPEACAEADPASES